jgi:hypothetical protein
MAISSVSGVTPPAPHAHTNQVKTRRDSDGDKDGSKAGEVEKTSAQQPKVASSGTVGTIINTKA